MSYDTIEVVAEEGDHRAIIDYDPEPSPWANPRAVDGGKIGIMWTRHPSYTLGDHPDGEGMPASDAFDEVDTFVDLMLEHHHGSAVTEAVVKHLVRTHGATVVLPLYLLDHSGLVMSSGWANLVENLTSDDERKRAFVMDPGGWDTSYVGFIFDTPARRADLGEGVSVEQALRDEVSSYDDYLQGQVYCIAVEQKVKRTTTTESMTGDVLGEDEAEDWDEVEGSGGYLGRDHAVESAKQMLAGFGNRNEED